MRRIALLLAGLGLAGPVAAAPLCISVQGVPDQCIYADGASCGKRAAQLGGICTANPKEAPTPVGPGHYCLVAQGQPVDCIYSDQNTCIADAGRRHTTCVPSQTPPPGTFDPFFIRRPY